MKEKTETLTCWRCGKPALACLSDTWAVTCTNTECGVSIGGYAERSAALRAWELLRGRRRESCAGRF